MTMRFFIVADVTPDDEGEGVSAIAERLEKAIEHSTAAEALSAATRATVTLRLATDEDF
jgi:hypothetical protein